MVRRAAGRYDARREGLIRALAERGVAARGRTGLNVWVPVADETTAVATLRDAGWAVAPGSRYRISSEPALRITISTLTEDELAPLADAVARPISGGHGV